MAGMAGMAERFHGAAWRTLVVVVTLWLVDGVITGSQFHAMQEASGTPVTWRAAMVPSLAGALLWVPFSLLVLHLTRLWPIGRQVRNVGIHIAGFVFVVLGRAAAVVAFNPLIGWYAELPAWPDLLLTSLQNNVLLYVLLTGAAHGLHYARQHRLREAQLARAELTALRAQIQPHFLFNALNTISASVQHDPETAERMIARLSTLLRRSLEYGGALVVPLHDELHVASCYLDIEQARFADRLSVTWDVEGDALGAAIPAFLLQPLVENAVRHGLWPRSAPGSLRVAAWLSDSQLHLSVEDDGVGLSQPGPTRTGVGLSNTRARLEQLYGRRHTFDVQPKPAGGTVVHLAVPYRPAAADAAAGARRSGGA